MNNQLATRGNSLKDLLDKPAIKSRFESVLRNHANSFVVSILTASSNNPKIAECDPMSVISSALTIASLGLSLSSALGQAAIVPFRGKATPMIMRKGLVQLALRTNQYRYIHVTPIYEGEAWNVDRLTGQVKLTGAKNSPVITGYCAYFQLMSGYEKYLPMSMEEILDHAKKYSKSWDAKSGTFYKGSGWDTSFEKMCEKTPLRMLLLNWGPMSAEMQVAIEVENETGEVAYDYDIDAEIETTREEQKPERHTEAQIMADLGYTQFEAPEPVFAEEPEYVDPPTASMSLETAEAMVSHDGTPYGSKTTEELSYMANSIVDALKKNGLTTEKHDTYQMKLDACRVILASRAGGAA